MASPPPPPPSPWPARRVAAAVLTAGLVGVAAHAVSVGVIGVLPVLVLGIFLGGLYVARGGSLPPWAYRLMTRRGRGSLTADDDPSNLPAKVYLSVLLAALLVAALIVFLNLR